LTALAILIVEDNPIISAQIEKSINSIGKDIKILKSKEGVRALKIAETIEIAVFIIDIGLPDWDGVELANEIRKTYPYHPIIIESSKNDPQYQIHIHDQIENLAFLKKPYTNEKLIAKVKHALDIAKSLGSNQLKIKQNGFSRLIEINDILYIEKVKGKRKIEIILYHSHRQSLIREEFISVSLSALLETLKDKRDLFRCHKAYIVNPKMIEKLNYVNNTISLKYTEAEIPIGKTYKKSIDLLL